MKLANANYPYELPHQFIPDSALPPSLVPSNAFKKVIDSLPPTFLIFRLRLAACIVYTLIPNDFFRLNSFGCWAAVRC